MATEGTKPGEQRQNYRLTLAALLVAALAFAISQTLVVPALPEIQRELGTTQTLVTFVLTSFLVTASVATPIVGRFGDMFGKERLLLITLVVFGIGSLVAALSNSIEVLIAGRAIQGVAGAVFPLSFGIIRDEFPPERVAVGIGTISTTFGVGGSAGLLLSGVIVESLSYEWLFWLSLVVVAIAVVAVHLFVPESPIKTPARIDWGGALLLSVGLVALLVVVSEANRWGLSSPSLLATLALATGSLATLLWYERRQPDPMIDVVMMRIPTVLITNLTAMLIGFGMFGSFILIPQFVQTPAASGYGFGATVTGAGIFMLPSAVVMLFAGPMSGWLGARFGSKLPLLIGTALATASFLLLALAHEEPWTVYLGSGLLGLGIGFSFAAMANLVVGAVPQTQTGVATGINTIMRTIGGSVGGQLTAAIVGAHVLAATGFPDESAYTTTFLISAVGVGTACLLATRLRGQRQTQPRPAAATGH